MASWAGAARAPAQPAALPRPRSRPARAPVARTRTFGGVLWIVLFAALLGGVVAVNVAVLQLNVRLDGLGRERVQLRADNARLSSEISRAGADARIESQARSRLGLEPAETTEFIDLTPAAGAAVTPAR
jgi:cell division protein FtsL